MAFSIFTKMFPELEDHQSPQSNFRILYYSQRSPNLQYKAMSLELGRAVF